MSLEMKELLDTIPQTGTVNWIGVRPDRDVPVESLESVEVCLENGLSATDLREKPVPRDR